MGTIRCRLTLELHDQVLLHSELVNGVLFKTYLVNSMIKDVNSPIAVLYRTENAPHTDGTVLAVQADAVVSRGNVKAKAYEYEVQSLELATAVPAPYTTRPKLFFDAVILREIHSDSWTGRGGVFEIEVAVDFGDEKDGSAQLDVRCSLPRQKKAFKKLSELSTTQSVRVCGEITGWVHANMISLEVSSLDPLNKPPPGVGRKLDLSGRGRRSNSPVKGVGRDGSGRRARAHSPVKASSPTRAASPVKELASSFDTFSLRGRSASPVKDHNIMGPPEYPSPSRAIFASQPVDSHEALLGSHPVVAEPSKSVEIMPIPVPGKVPNTPSTQESTCGLLVQPGPERATDNVFDDLFSSIMGGGVGNEMDGLSAIEKSHREFVKAMDLTLAAGEGDIPAASFPLPLTSELVGNDSGEAISGAPVVGTPAPIVPQPGVDLAANIALDEAMVEEFLKSMTALEGTATITGASLQSEGSCEKTVSSWDSSFELPPPSSGLWSF